METYLAHHGILGMKWGVRRYQNEDGTLTEAGKRRYGKIDSSEYARRSGKNAAAAAATAGSSMAVGSIAKNVGSYAKDKSASLWNTALLDMESGKEYAKLLDERANELTRSHNAELALKSTDRDIDRLRKLAADASKGIFRTDHGMLEGLDVKAPSKNAGMLTNESISLMYKARIADLEKIRDSQFEETLTASNSVAARSNDIAAFRNRYLGEASARASQYASVARAATTVAGIVSGVGAVTTIGFGAIAAGQLAYSAYLKHQAKKVQNSN